MFLDHFKNPGSILRPAPFWAINDEITPAETARQMQDLIEKGFSGGFFHSRAGLITDYMSEQWFDCMKAALATAKMNDGYLWLYDEDLWPSGNAGGQVAARKDEYRQAVLHAELIAAGQNPRTDLAGKEMVAFRILRRQSLELSEYEEISTAEARADTSSERLIFRRLYAPKTGRWSGESYSNLLHPEVTQTFIELTHERYKKELSADFGGSIPGIFTDEPQIACGAYGPNTIPWWDGLLDLYDERYKRKLLTDLPLLFFDGDQARAIRQKFYRLVNWQFAEAYSRPLYEWCEANQLEHTGHYNAEETLVGQINNHAGSIMVHYKYQQAPGIDHLCRQIHGGHPYVGNAKGMELTVKQVASAARQLGRPRVLSEIFGVSHHANSFEDFKWLADFDIVLGANFLCPHLSWYSMRGKRKRDYPPNWNYQQTYWDDLKPLNDYFARLGYVHLQGKAKVETLVLCPIEAAMAAWRKPLSSAETVTPAGIMRADAEEQVDRLDNDYRLLVKAVLNSGLDCDLGDEDYLERFGSVHNSALRIGEMEYNVVLMPPAITWRPFTYELLQQFAAAGGTIIMTGALPRELDCQSAAEEWHTLITHKNVELLPISAREVQACLERVVESGYRLRLSTGSPASGVYVQHRLQESGETFFIVNTSRVSSVSLTLTIPEKSKRRLYVLDALTGEHKRMPTIVADGTLLCNFLLPMAGSMLLLATEETLDKSEAYDNTSIRVAAGTRFSAPWQYCKSEENALPLDRFSYSLDDGSSFSEAKPDYIVRHEIARHFGTEAALEWQPWVAVRKKLFDKQTGRVLLKYSFQTELQQVVSAAVVIEDIQQGTLTVNGHTVSTHTEQWQWDRRFGKVNVASWVQKGHNEIVFAFDYNFLAEIETAYIVGEFGVDLSNSLHPVLTAAPVQLQNGSWRSQGFPFYSGSMTYVADMAVEPLPNRRYCLRLRNPSGILFKVRVNGREAGNILWAPYELDVTDLLASGQNKFEITVVSSRSNIHGPLHIEGGDTSLWHGPQQFDDTMEGYSLVDYGLLDGAELVIVDK